MALNKRYKAQGTIEVREVSFEIQSSASNGASDIPRVCGGQYCLQAANDLTLARLSSVDCHGKVLRYIIEIFNASARLTA